MAGRGLEVAKPVVEKVYGYAEPHVSWACKNVNDYVNTFEWNQGPIFA
jgi:hypothetical protein